MRGYYPGCSASTNARAVRMSTRVRSGTRPHTVACDAASPRLLVAWADRDDLRGVDRHQFAVLGLRQVGKGPGAAASSILELLDDLGEGAVDLELITRGEK